MTERAFDALSEGRPDYLDHISDVDEAAQRLDVYVSAVVLEGPHEADLAAHEMVGALRQWTNSLTLVAAHLQGDYDPLFPDNLSYERMAEQAERSYQFMDEFTLLCRRLISS